MREMKDSNVKWAGHIPSSWNMIPVKYFVSIDNGSDPKTEGDVPVYGSGSRSFRTCGEYKDGPTVLLGRKGTVNIPQYIEGRYWNVDTAYDVKPKNICNLRYFYYCSICFDYESYSTQTALPSMTATNYGSFKVPFISLHQQAQIVAQLDLKTTQIDALIANQQAQIEKLKAYKQSLITEVVTKGLDPNVSMKNSEVEWIGQMPATWRIERGKALFQETDARSVDGSEELLTVSQYTGITPRSQKNVNMFEALTLEGYKICEVGDIAANTMWLWAGAIGVSEYRGVISPSYNVYRQKGENFIPKYLDYLLRAPLLVQEYASRSTGIRASRLRLYPQDFFEILFPIPPKEEQAEMVKFLEDKFAVTDQLIAIKEAKIEKLQQYKKSLIYEYVTGKKEVV